MNIYISLTTVPKRMEFWDSSSQNLKSLLTQNTIRPYKVILNIPYYYKINNNEEYILSDNLIKLSEDYPNLIINRVEKDYGPIVKLTGVIPISKNDDDVIIVCDDDHVYHEDMLEYHIKKLEEYPNSAIAFRGDSPVEKREWVENGVKKYTIKPTHFYFPVKHDSQLAIPGHWHSVGYKRNFFNDDFMTDDFLMSSENDDILIGYYLKKKSIQIICTTWDKETDWRAVNDYGRPSYSFPIKYSLPFPDSGFYEFRLRCGDVYGRSNKEITDLIGNHDTIYIEK